MRPLKAKAEVGARLGTAETAETHPEPGGHDGEAIQGQVCGLNMPVGRQP